MSYIGKKKLSGQHPTNAISRKRNKKTEEVSVPIKEALEVLAQGMKKSQSKSRENPTKFQRNKAFLKLPERSDRSHTKDCKSEGIRLL